jgi:ABC-type transporter Mla subunit MlaD
MGSRAHDLQTIINAGNQVFETTAARNTEITRTIRAFPPFLRTTREALAVIDAAAKDIEPTLRAIRPVIPLFGPALAATNRLAPELDRTFSAAVPFLAAAQRGFPALTRILNVSQPALKVLYVAGRELIPIADYLKLMRQDIVSAAAKTGSATEGTMPDGSQQILRSIIPVSEETLVAAAARLPSNRHNPYLAPNALNSLASGLKAYDCNNLGNPQTVPVAGTAPATCTVQGPYKFRGLSRYFPRVELGAP